MKANIKYYLLKYKIRIILRNIFIFANFYLVMEDPLSTNGNINGENGAVYFGLNENEDADSTTQASNIDSNGSK